VRENADISVQVKVCHDVLLRLDLGVLLIDRVHS
jgi:hypothetical protein